MHKPILKNEEINFSNLFSFFYENKFKILIYTSIYTVFSMISFLLGPSKFEASISFYTNYREKADSSFIVSLADLAGGTGDLKFSVEDFLESDYFINGIIYKKFNINNNNLSLAEYWGKDLTKNTFSPIQLLLNMNNHLRFHSSAKMQDKQGYIARKVLEKSLKFSQDKKTQLSTVSIKIKNDPYLAEQVIKEIYESIVLFSNQITNTKASEKVLFVEERLKDINNKLETSENSMIEFLTNNKNLDSPHLKTKEDRLQRDILLYNQLFISLSDQLELAKIEEKNNTSSIFMLDKPILPVIKSGNSLLKGGFYSFIYGIILSTLYLLFRQRKQYF
tara:strand:+ start:5856 stop:6857 length:1002 start_codon:yes stop_codon:yes gene_type:complete